MYYVLGDGGAKFGPADVPTLKQWVAEGRLTQTTMLEDAVTGQVMAATSVPDLFPATGASAPGPVSSGPTTTSGPYTVPDTPSSSPYGAPTGEPSHGSQYAAPQNPYPRMDMAGPSKEAETYATWTWILGAVGFLCCCCLSLASIFTAVKARQLGHPKGDILLFYSIGMTVGGIVIGMIMQAATGGFTQMMNQR